MIDPRVLRLCLVTDRDMAGPRQLPDIVEAAVRGGVTMVQLREKGAPTRRFVEEARALLDRLRPLGVPLVINDRVDIALAIGTDGVHVGQDDMPVDAVRRLLGFNAILGLSITHPDDLLNADVDAADYLGVGPVFQQATKHDATPPVGLAGLAAVRRGTSKPLMAIGGIDCCNADAVWTSGADGLAVVSAIMAAPDPEAAARGLVRSG